MQERLRDWLSSSLHIPRYLIAVESSLEVKRYISDFRLKATGWTLFAREHRGETQPSFTYATFDPRTSQSVERASDFIGEYVRNHGGTVVYTDFDEHVRRLDAKRSTPESVTAPVRMRASK